MGEEIRGNENREVGYNAKVWADRQTGRHTNRQTHRNETAATDKDIVMRQTHKQTDTKMKLQTLTEI